MDADGEAATAYQRMHADDEELIPDPPAQGPHATTPAAPPEAHEADFWTRMDLMTTRQSEAIRQDLGAVEGSLDQHITKGLRATP